MDIEAKKKYCGLLMFDAPSVSSNSSSSQNSSTRGVDPTFYDSSANSMFIQETFNEYAEPQPRALAAGAALGDNVQDSSDGKSNSNDDKSQPPKRTPRPPNAFILYRQAKQPGIIASIKNPTNAQVSRKISEMWKNESEETRLYWERVADRKKLEHMQAHPDYVYRPNKNRNKVDKRRTRPRASSKDQTSAATKKSRLQRGSDRTPLVNLPSQINMSDLDHIVPSSIVTTQVSQSNKQIRQHPNQYPSIIQSHPMLTVANMNELMPKQQFQQLPAMNSSPTTPLTPPQEMVTLHSQFKASVPSVVPGEEGKDSFQHYQGNHLPQQYDYQAAMFPSELVFVPEVARQPFGSELMLHHTQPEPCTPTSNDSSSVSNSPTLQSADQYYNGYFHELLNTEFYNNNWYSQ